MIRIRGSLLYGEVGDIYALNGFPLTFGMKGGGIYADEEGYLYIPVPMISIRFDGIVDTQGALHFQLPMLQDVQFSGYTSTEGILNINIPQYLIKFTGQQEITGVLNILLPRREFVASGVINENGVLNITIPTVSFSGSVESEIGIGLTVEIPMIRVHMDGYSSVEGDLDITIPMILFHMEQSAEADDYLTMVMNIRNKALTTFDNYNFNSMCAFGGRHFGATGANIFDLDTGDKDNGVPIEWNFKTGYLDLEQKRKKKLVQAWTSYKTDGDIKFTLVQPDGGQYEYILQGIDTTETGLRVKFGKGIKTKYVALNISNIDGSSIDLDELKLHLATSTFVKVR
jgi:hypothetical protein